MALKGELLSADLSNVFQMLAMNGKRGLLTVQDRVNPVARKRFYLDGQTVFLADPVGSRPSVALLVEMGRITYDQYASAVQRARRFNSDVFSILKTQGTVGEQELEALRTRVANESLLDVFLWRDIRFTLDETATGAVAPDCAPLQLDHVILEAARRQDEWQHIVQAVGSHREVFRKCQEAANVAALGPIERIVLDHLNGIDSTPELMRKCELPRYFVDLSLAALLRAGVISRLLPEELIIAGDALLAEGRIEEGIRLFHAALRSDRMNPAIHKRLADAHEKAGQFARACGHLRFCSVVEIQEDRRREALNLLQRAWSLLPTQFSTLDRILSVILEDPAILTREDRACVADGRRLLQVWQDTGEYERAVELAARLWAIDCSDREVLHTAARLNVRLGRIDAAVSSYVALAERMREDHEAKGALDIYRMIASLDAGNAQTYHAVIDELKRSLEEEAARKRRGRSLRGAAMTLVAAGVLYAGYCWFGSQVLRDIDERLAATPEGRDAILPQYRKAAVWFALAPAGTRAAQVAAGIDAELLSERDARARAEERAASRVAAQQRAADEAVSEGLRMVKSGDLPGAVERLREGLASFPSAESPAASRAARALDDVQAYLAQGRRLLEEARKLEETDPDAAFRLRLKAMRDYDLLPEAKTLKLTLRVDSVPPDAKLLVDGVSKEYSAPIGIEVAGQGLLSLEARAPGYVPRALSMPLPPEVATWTVVLEKIPRGAVKTSEPLASAVAIDDDLVLAASRTGSVYLVDAAGAKVVARFRPEGIDSQSRPPVVSASRVLCVLDDGRVRVLDLPTLREVRASRLPVLAGIAPAACDTGWVVVSAPDRIDLIDREGNVTRRFSLGQNVVVRDVAVTGGIAWCATGELGVIGLDPKSDGRVQCVSSKFSTSVAAGPGGSLLVYRPQVGIVRLDPLTSAETVLLQHAGDRARIRQVCDGRWGALFDGELVFLTEHGASGRVRARGCKAEGTLVVNRAAGTAGLIVDGWCSMYDARDGACISGYACDPGTEPAFVNGTFANAHVDGRVTFTDP